MTRLIIVALAIVAATLGAAAADWPAQPVRIIVPFAAGATPDLVARLIADSLRQTTGQTIIVENKPGASGNTGTDAVARAAPDGATLGVSIGGPLAVNTLLFPHLPYDPGKDLALITTLASQPSALAVNAGLNVDTVTGLIALIRRHPGRYAYGSIGTGSLSQLAMEAIALGSGTRLVHVPYASSPQAVTALMRGDVQMACLPAISITPFLGSGKIKLLAITTAQRSALLPGVPTLKESGVDVEADAWMGLIAPAGLPPDMEATINRLVTAAIGSPAVRQKLAAQLMEPIPGTPQQFRARIADDIARWKPVIAAAKIGIR